MALSAASVTVEGQRGGNTEELQYPELLPESLLLIPADTIQVAFTLINKSSGRGVAPQQAMVRATSEVGSQAFFLARSVGDVESGARSASITSSALAKQLGASPSRVKLALLVGDPAVGNPMQWDFAQVTPPPAILRSAIICVTSNILCSARRI